MGGYNSLPQLQNVNLGQTLQEAQALRSGQQDAQIRDLQIQAKQREIQDQQTVMQTLQQTGGDINKALPMLSGKVTPNTFKGVLATAKDLSGYNDDVLKRKQTQNSNLFALFQQASQLPDDQYAQAWPQIVAKVREIAPDSPGINQLDPNQIVPKQQLAQEQLGLLTTDKLLSFEADKRAAAAEQRAAAKAPYEQATAVANARKATAEAANQESQAQFYKGANMVPGVPIENQEAADWLKKNPGKTISDYQKYKAALVPAINFNLQANGANVKTPTDNAGNPLTGDALYKSFGAQSGTVRAIVEGRQAAPSGFAQKTPYWQKIMQEVYQVDPQWNEQRAQIRKAFTVGKDAQNIRSLNTAAVHLDSFSEAAKALQNGTFTPGNAFYNKVSQVIGYSAPTTFEGLRSAVAGEMANALKGNATDPEIASIKNTIMSQNSPEQLSKWVDSNLHIIGQKLNTYKEAYDQQNPGDTVYSPVLPSAAAVFQKHSVTTGDSTMQPPSGGKVINYKIVNGQLVQQ